MKRDPSLYLEDILEAITIIEQYLANSDRTSFEKDLKLQDAVIRRIEIIGEAAKHLPSSFREKYPAVPWKDFAGMRDILIHAYLNVNIERVWEVVKRDIPFLKKEVQRIISKKERG